MICDYLNPLIPLSLRVVPRGSPGALFTIEIRMCYLSVSRESLLRASFRVNVYGSLDIMVRTCAASSRLGGQLGGPDLGSGSARAAAEARSRAAGIAQPHRVGAGKRLHRRSPRASGSHRQDSQRGKAERPAYLPSRPSHQARTPPEDLRNGGDHRGGPAGGRGEENGT